MWAACRRRWRTPTRRRCRRSCFRASRVCQARIARPAPPFQPPCAHALARQTVYLGAELKEKYYTRFCKQTLWPLMHYLLPLSPSSAGRFDRSLWGAYLAANKKFSDVLMEVIAPDEDFVWVHDYHLMLLPSFLRKRFNTIRLAFFLHCPFPSSELFRAFPPREALLRAALNCDVVGFHTFDYARHFLSCCSRMLGLAYQSRRGALGIDYYGRNVCVKICPTGVDPVRLRRGLAAWPEAAWRRGELVAQFAGKLVFVGSDDLDVFKGIDLKLRAFEALLDAHPELRAKAVLVQIVAPARSATPQLGEVLAAVTELAARINAAFTDGASVGPVVLLQRHVPLHERIALLSVADCCVVTATRDGMNLSPYEYVACRQGPLEAGDEEEEGGNGGAGSGPPSGVGAAGAASAVSTSHHHAAHPTAVDLTKTSALVVSEFVGCSPSLSGALRVNPWNVEETADALFRAISQSPREKAQRHAKHWRYISEHTASYWAASCFAELQRATAGHGAMRCYGLGFGLTFRIVALDPNFRRLPVERVAACYAAARGGRALVFDYDGTLVPASPSFPQHPSPDLVAALSVLAADPRNEVYIVSGRRRALLDDWFGKIPGLGLSAEHGAYLRQGRGNGPWEELAPIAGGPLAVAAAGAQQGPGAGTPTQPSGAATRRSGSGGRPTLPPPVPPPQAAASAPAPASAPPTTATLSQPPPRAPAPKPPVPSIAAASPASAAAAVTAAAAAASAAAATVAAVAAGAATPPDARPAEAAAAAWRDLAMPILELYTDSTDGSFVERKDSALVWHYADADPELGAAQAKELLDHLESVLASEPVEVVASAGTVEIKPQGVSKALAVARLLDLAASRHPGGIDFALCLGDDRGDEEMFAYMEGRAREAPGAPPPRLAQTIPSLSNLFLNVSRSASVLSTSVAVAGRAVQLHGGAEAIARSLLPHRHLRGAVPAAAAGGRGRAAVSNHRRRGAGAGRAGAHRPGMRGSPRERALERKRLLESRDTPRPGRVDTLAACHSTVARLRVLQCLSLGLHARVKRVPRFTYASLHATQARGCMVQDAIAPPRRSLFAVACHRAGCMQPPTGQLQGIAWCRVRSARREQKVIFVFDSTPCRPCRMFVVGSCWSMSACCSSASRFIHRPLFSQPCRLHFAAPLFVRSPVERLMFQAAVHHGATAGAPRKLLDRLLRLGTRGKGAVPKSVLRDVGAL